MTPQEKLAQEKAAKKQEMEKLLADRVRAKRKARRSHDDGKNALTLNSMMDMMTIILVFLLKSYGEEPLVILPNTDVPLTVLEATPEDTTVITVNKEGIFMVRERILEIEGGKVSATFKKGGESGLIIEPLEAALRREAETLKSNAMQTGDTFKGDITIIADQSVNYRLLVEVMQTAIGAEFKQFRFAAIQGNMQESGRYPGAPPAPK